MVVTFISMIGRVARVVCGCMRTHITVVQNNLGYVRRFNYKAAVLYFKVV